MNSSHLICYFFLMLFAHSAAAQSYSLTGIVNGSGKPVDGATVSLLNDADSSWITSGISSDIGVFRFDHLHPGGYLVSVSAIGFATVLKHVQLTDSIATVTIDMQTQDAALKEVTVAAARPFMEMSPGKLTVNLDGAAIGSSNALDLLRRLPGVIVSPDGTISINGRQGVLVLINDRPTYLSGDELAIYLRSINANEITQIELITQPGARYDATGNTGVINFKMKRNKKSGLNGNVGLLLGQGVYANGQGNVQLNYRKDRINVLLSASDHEAKGFGDWRETQYTIDPGSGAVIGVNNIHATPWERFGTGAVRCAADYEYSTRTTIGASVRATYHPNSSYGYTSSSKADNSSTGIVYNDVVNPDGFIRKDIVTNAYLTHKFGKEHVLDINIDYLKYGNYARQDVDSRNYDALMQPLPGRLLLHGDQRSLINVVSVKADHSYTFSNGIKLESGVKSSFVTTDNNAAFSVFTNSSWADDTLRSNHFLYRENINAAYISASHTFGEKWDAKGGLRAEETNAGGTQYVHDYRFSRDYVSVFPTGFIDYKPDSSNVIELNYGRRIDRPAYKLLNPFINYSFQYNYSAGNPYLLPQYTHNIELKHSYKNTLVTTLSFSSTTDVISSVLISDNAGKLYSTNRNEARNRELFCYVVFNKDLMKRWTFTAGGYAAWSVYTGMTGSGNITNQGLAYSFNWNTQFSAGKGWKVSVNGYYEHNSIVSIIETYGAQLYMSFGASKKIHDNMLFRLSVNDPFHVCKLTVHNSMDNFRSDAVFRNATQMATLEFNYSFGRKEQTNDRKNTLDESGRIK